ncbi:MAG TPA: DUF4402 domain-containing protein [Candidatus Krumholzibacteria bacterium]|nr:DUF4402 domain-containing protein [Candidatus Krumholzibacteria bacterium]HPD71803.1 DUF4402 domain-containing protein [Candidatus Krumholzibacteria bacterium]HRY41264.1 DUF4402 domain-containing protein [Candidatus Krumholzibacteria bacterium]
MKNFSRFSILAVVLFAFAGSAGAVDLVTNAQVDIITGITILQTQALNFGVLVLNNGSVTVAAADGSTTDADNLISNATDIAQGVFDVTSTLGADLTVNCTAGVQPTGVTLDAFTADWAAAGEAAVPLTRTLAATTEQLEIGATITIDRTQAEPTEGTPVNLPYTVSVTFQ